MNPEDPNKPITPPQAAMPVNPASGTPIVTPPVQPASPTPPTPPVTPDMTPSEPPQGGSGISKWFLIIPGIMVIVLIGLFVGYFMTVNKKAPEPEVISKPVVTPTNAPTPTPTVVLSEQEKEVNQVDIGSPAADLQDITTDLGQL